MFAESHPLIRSCFRFLLLPHLYYKICIFKDCKKNKLRVLLDLLTIYYKYKTFPDHYYYCRLWEKNKQEWALYFGSTYNPNQRQRLRVLVQPFKWLELFNNKTKCSEFFVNKNIPMPITFATLKIGENIETRLSAIFEKENKDKLFLKPIFGMSGRGVVIAKKTETEIKIENKDTSISAQLFKIDEPYLVQEVISQNAIVSSIAPDSVNTVRTISMYTKNDEIILLSASMRFSVGKSVADNWCAGGVGVGVNCANGTLKKYAYNKKGEVFTHHPISGICFEGFEIPLWKDIYALTIKVQEASPFYRLLGLDIAITPTGPIVIEINANPDIVFQEQTSGPLLADKKALIEFAKYDLLYNQHQKALIKSNG